MHERRVAGQLQVGRLRAAAAAGDAIRTCHAGAIQVPVRWGSRSCVARGCSCGDLVVARQVEERWYGFRQSNTTGRTTTARPDDGIERAAAP